MIFSLLPFFWTTFKDRCTRGCVTMWKGSLRLFCEMSDIIQVTFFLWCPFSCHQERLLWTLDFSSCCMLGLQKGTHNGQCLLPWQFGFNDCQCRAHALAVLWRSLGDAHLQPELGHTWLSWAQILLLKVCPTDLKHHITWGLMRCAESESARTLMYREVRETPVRFLLALISWFYNIGLLSCSKTFNCFPCNLNSSAWCLRFII